MILVRRGTSDVESRRCVARSATTLLGAEAA